MSYNQLHEDILQSQLVKFYAARGMLETTYRKYNAQNHVIIEIGSNEKITIATYENTHSGLAKFRLHRFFNWVGSLFSDTKTYVEKDAVKHLLLNMASAIKEMTHAFALDKPITEDFGERFELFRKLEPHMQNQLIYINQKADELFKGNESTEIKKHSEAAKKVIHSSMFFGNVPRSFIFNSIKTQIHNLNSGNVTTLESIKQLDRNFDGLSTDLKDYSRAIAEDFKNLAILAMRSFCKNAMQKAVKTLQNENISADKKAAVAKDLEERLNEKKYDGYLSPSLVTECQSALKVYKKTVLREELRSKLLPAIHNLEKADLKNLKDVDLAYTRLHVLIHDEKLQNAVDEFEKNDAVLSELKPAFNPRESFEEAKRLLKSVSAKVLTTLISETGKDLAELQSQKQKNEKLLSDTTARQQKALDVLNQFQALNPTFAQEPVFKLLKDLLTYYTSPGNKKELGEQITNAFASLKIKDSKAEVWPVKPLIEYCKRLHNQATHRVSELASSLEDLDAQQAGAELSIKGFAATEKERLATLQTRDSSMKKQWVVLESITTNASQVLQAMTSKSTALDTLQQQMAKHQDLIPEYQRELARMSGLQGDMPGPILFGEVLGWATHRRVT